MFTSLKKWLITGFKFVSSFFIIGIPLILLQNLISIIAVLTHEAGHAIFDILSGYSVKSITITYDGAPASLSSFFNIDFTWFLSGYTQYNLAPSSISLSTFFINFGGILLTTIVLVLLYLIKSHRLIEKKFSEKTAAIVLTELLDFFLLWFSICVFEEAFIPNMNTYSFITDLNSYDAIQSLTVVNLWVTPFHLPVFSSGFYMFIVIFVFGIFVTFELIYDKLAYFNVNPFRSWNRMDKLIIALIVISIVYIISEIIPLMSFLIYAFSLMYILLMFVIYMDVVNDKLITRRIIPSLTGPLKLLRWKRKASG
ncbi:MAG TPA: M50 family metallopeptidase [Methanocella sp.]|uniref:M50 family metallopeptidase n=1 Tax=Methanocella sp. TaxID=2052833 RepID=UPI002CA3CE35|nr:M50 family metallopeptidase [Methanocella sp.]HTY91342.1 M50 family metallopeptidase [Methanocella sp.]